MKPLRLASIDEASRQRTIHDLLTKWRNGDPDVRKLFRASDWPSALAAITDHMFEMNENEKVYTNNQYQ